MFFLIRLSKPAVLTPNSFAASLYNSLFSRTELSTPDVNLRLLRARSVRIGSPPVVFFGWKCLAFSIPTRRRNSVLLMRSSSKARTIATNGLTLKARETYFGKPSRSGIVPQIERNSLFGMRNSAATLLQNSSTPPVNTVGSEFDMPVRFNQMCVSSWIRVKTCAEYESLEFRKTTGAKGSANANPRNSPTDSRFGFPEPTIPLRMTRIPFSARPRKVWRDTLTRLWRCYVPVHLSLE